MSKKKRFTARPAPGTRRPVKHPAFGPKALPVLKTALLAAFFLAAALLIDVKNYRLKLLSLETGELIFLTLVAAAVSIRGRIAWKKNPLDKWVALYFLYVIVRFALMSNRDVSRMEIERNILCFGLYFTFSQFVASSEIKNVLKVYIASAFIVALYGLWQNFGTPILWFRVPKISPPWATFGNQNFFAAYIVIVLPLAFYLLKQKSVFWKIFAAVSAVIFILDLHYIRSRGGILAAFASGAVFVLARYGLKSKYMKIAAACFIVAAAAGGWATRRFWFRDVNRLLIWRDTLVMALKNPFGVGPGGFASNFPDYASTELKKVYPQNKLIVNFAHDEYLEIFAELGAPGLILFAMIIITFFRRCRNPYLAASAAGILTHNLFSVNMRFIISSAFLYIVFALYRSMTSEEKEIQLKGALHAVPPVLAAGTILFFVPKMLEPFRALKENAAEPDFYGNVNKDEISSLENKLKAHPGDYDTLYKLGWLCAKKKQYTKAVDYFISAAKVRPTPGIWNNIGNIFYETGNRPKAIEAYSRAIAMDPNMVDPRFNLGYVYFHEGRLKEASECFREVLKRDKNNAKAIMMLEQMKQ